MVWQTGAASFEAVKAAFVNSESVFVFPTITDLYPYYAAARVVVGRAGASTLAEVSLFGLPAVLVPLPWAAENHQWFNAGLAQEQGWGIRIAQDSATGANVERAMEKILSDKNTYDGMHARALENSPAQAAAKIVGHDCRELGL